MSSDDTRQRILDAAGPVFADKGYRRATVREICQAAQVNLASVNYYFGDKERLYIETVKRARTRRVSQVPLPQRGPEASPVLRLSDFVLTLLRRMLGEDPQRWEARLMVREVIEPTRACRELVEEYFRPQLDLLLSILDELITHDVPDYRRRQMAYSIIGQCLFYRVAGQVVRMLTPEQELAEHYRPEALAEHIVDWSLAAIEPHRRSSTAARQKATEMRR